MADHGCNSTKSDSHRINVNERQEVAYWTEELGVTELELRAAVGKVGLSAGRVRDFVKPAK